MTANELAAKMKSEIDKLNELHAAQQAARFAFSEIADSDDTTEEQFQTASRKMAEVCNEYDRVELHIQVTAEKILGKGRELGRFMESAMRW